MRIRNPGKNFNIDIFYFFKAFREALTKQQKKRASISDFSPGSEDQGSESDKGSPKKKDIFIAGNSHGARVVDPHPGINKCNGTVV
jgi:hypothetical protein